MSDEKKVKPGWKTTEFWMTTAASIVAIVLDSGFLKSGSTAETVIEKGQEAIAQSGGDPGQLAIIIIGALWAAYGVSRGLAKK